MSHKGKTGVAGHEGGAAGAGNASGKPAEKEGQSHA
jgi:hypothetical protein